RVPWQRVINAKGEVSARVVPGYDGYQRAVLKREGVRFDARGRVDLARYRWRAGPPGTTGR
ncbi:MAG TPA: methyltransferase, partial [Thermoanaerobaculia bacterium]|nr:methyltransferase [Thermoanaerobaculia bacterium]